MNETGFEPVVVEPEVEKSISRKIEPDWTESEWFQVWLKLARHAWADEPSAQGAH